MEHRRISTTAQRAVRTDVAGRTQAARARSRHPIQRADFELPISPLCQAGTDWMGPGQWLSWGNTRCLNDEGARHA